MRLWQRPERFDPNLRSFLCGSPIAAVDRVRSDSARLRRGRPPRNTVACAKPTSNEEVCDLYGEKIKDAIAASPRARGDHARLFSAVTPIGRSPGCSTSPKAPSRGRIRLGLHNWPAPDGRRTEGQGMSTDETWTPCWRTRSTLSTMTSAAIEAYLRRSTEAQVEVRRLDIAIDALAEATSPPTLPAGSWARGPPCAPNRWTRAAEPPLPRSRSLPVGWSRSSAPVSGAAHGGYRGVGRGRGVDRRRRGRPVAMHDGTRRGIAPEQLAGELPIPNAAAPWRAPLPVSAVVDPRGHGSCSPVTCPHSRQAAPTSLGRRRHRAHLAVLAPIQDRRLHRRGPRPAPGPHR